ncbi:hypothetical protein NW754_001564 [Fusarium falciforme]|nr:hypothetical protein NW754_001564 [Fusarium falciforme]
MTTHGDGAIRPRRRRRGDPHICPHCTRVFKRSEHLGRHVRTHTKEKPFVCTCGAAFARRDLLTRHQRISLHTGEAQNPRPSPTPDVVTATTDSSLELDNASSWAEQQQLPADPQAYLDPDAQQDLMVTQETFDQCQTLDYNFDQFWEFAGFLDGIGLPAEWSPYFHGPDAHETTSGEAPKGNPPLVELVSAPPSTLGCLQCLQVTEPRIHISIKIPELMKRPLLCSRSPMNNELA